MSHTRTLHAAVLAGVLASLAWMPTTVAGEEEDGKRGDEIATLLKEMKDKEAVVRLDAATKAASHQDAKLLAPLLKLVKDENLLVRTAAAESLGARTDPAAMKKAASALAARLPRLSKSLDTRAELLVVVKSLHDLAQPGTEKALLKDVEAGTPTDVSEARTMAVANIPAAAAVEALIAFMSKGRKRGGDRGGVRKALQYATGEKFGNDPDAWRAWWKEAKKTFDFSAAAEKRAEQREKKSERAGRKNRKGKTN